MQLLSKLLLFLEVAALIQTVLVSTIAPLNPSCADITGTVSAETASTAASERAWLQSQLSNLQTASREAAETAAEAVASLETAVQHSASEQELLKDLQVIWLLHACRAHCKRTLVPFVYEITYREPVSDIVHVVGSNSSILVSDLLHPSRLTSALVTNRAFCMLCCSSDGSELLQLRTDALAATKQRLSAVETRSSADLKQHDAQAAELKSEVTALKVSPSLQLSLACHRMECPRRCTCTLGPFPNDVKMWHTCCSLWKPLIGLLQLRANIDSTCWRRD